MKHGWQIERNSICLATWKGEAAEKTVVAVDEIAAPSEWGVASALHACFAVRVTPLICYTTTAIFWWRVFW